MNRHCLVFLTISTLYVGCAHQGRANKLPGEWSVDSGKLTTGMPNYPLSQDAFLASQKKEVKRVPAMSDEALAESIEQEEQKPSLRRLYFKVLYQQWRELAQITGKDNQLKSCPQYHHDKTVMDETAVKINAHIVGLKPAATDLPFYPEWALSVKTEQGFVPAWSAGKKNHVASALRTHGFKLQKELRVLCEDGTSDAYFRLENMVSYLKDKAEFQGSLGLQALLKIPVFSTMLLMKSVEGSQQPQFNGYDQALLNEVKAFQLQGYIVELKQRRHRLLTGSL